MANLENNNNSENNKPISEKIGKKVQDVAEGVKHTIKNPVEAAKSSMEQAVEDTKHLSWWAKLFLWIVTVFSLIVIGLFIFVNLAWTRDRAASYVLGQLNEEFKVHIDKDKIDVNIFGDVSIFGLKIKDFKNNDFIKAKKLTADSDWFSIITNSRDLKFSTLTLSEAQINVVTYKGDSIDNFNRFIERFDDGKPRDPKKTPFQLKSRVMILDSKISIINQNYEGDEGKWLQAEDVNLVAPELKVIGPDISARINNFTFRTKRWGKVHFLDTFSTDFSMTKEKLSLKDLTLYTDHSLLQGDLTFHLNKETKWQDFTNKVNWEMNLKRGSSVSGYDISYFATKWDNYLPVNLSGKMNGTLNNFRLDDFVLSGKDVQINTPNAKFKNLLNGNFNIVTNKISADITYPALRAMVPKFVAQKMKNFADPFGRIRYTGAVDVTPKTVIAKGNAITNIGRADADIILSDIDKNEPRYEGLLNVKDFNTSAITKNNSVGLISGKFNVNGRGFDVNTLTLKTKSNISKIEITGKTLNNINLDGILSKKQYNGIININDKEARGKISGKIDFSTQKLLADIKGNIDYLNLSYFGVQGNGKSIFSGNIDGKIAFTSINDMHLDTNLNNVVFLAGNEKIDVPNGSVRAYFEDGNRIVQVDMPNVVRGKISGVYNLGDLGKMFENGFDKILVGNPERRFFKGQEFTYVFEINQKLVNYFEPNIKIPEGARINGSYKGSTNDLILNADASSLKYIMTKKEEISQADKLLAQANPQYKFEENKVIKDSAMVNNIIIRINTANPNEQIFANIGRAEYNKNVLRDVLLTGTNENNKSLHLIANLKHGSPEDEEKDALKSYTVSIDQSIDEKGDIVMKFEPTGVKFNNFVWNVDTSPELNHSITYRKKTKDFIIKNLRLYSDESILFVKESVFRNAKDFIADIELKNLKISKILALNNTDNEEMLDGIANGNIKINMNKSNFEPIIDVTIKDIKMKDKLMGDMVINAQNSDQKNVFNIDAKIISSELLGQNSFTLKGTIDNNGKVPVLDLDSQLNNFDLAFVQGFVGNIFSNFRGKANGNLKFTGGIDELDYNGFLHMNNFGLKVNFTGVDYSFAESDVEVLRGNLIFNSIIVKDGRNNSSGTISGALKLENFQNIAAQVLVRSDNLMLLNTEQKDFDLFWGKIYGKGDLDISFENNSLKVYAGKDTEQEVETFKVLNNSIFTLNSNTTSSVDEFKMLRFLQEDKEGVVSIGEGVKKGVNMDINIFLSVDKGSAVNVLVGDEIGDISVRGNSERLKFIMKPNGKITLDGTYSVDSGTYVSKAILEKTFQIDKLSKISWDGDPFNPSLNITANYYRTVSNAAEYLGIGNLPTINVLLQTKLSQNLKNPKIDFDILAPDVSSQIKEALATKLNYSQEKTMQFGSVLVLNNFNTSNTGGFGNVNIASVGSDLGYNLVLKQLGNVINTISEQFQIDLNYIKGDPLSNTSDRANTDINVVVSPRLTFKTSLGIPVSRNTLANNNTFSGQVEYDLSKKNDGTFIFRAYSKPSNIGLGSTFNTGANQTYGAGVVYSRSFNYFFKKNKKQKDSLQNVNTVKIDSLKKDTVK